MNFLKENNNITNYYYFDRVFSDEEINNILEISKKYNTENGTVSNEIDYNYRKSKITWIPQTEETKDIYQKIYELVKKANDKMWNFNLSHFKEDLQLGEYVEGEHYDWHMDVGTNCSTRKLSVSIQLSDPEEYEGGELNFYLNRHTSKAPKNKGTMIIFPSFFYIKFQKLHVVCEGRLLFGFMVQLSYKIEKY